MATVNVLYRSTKKSAPLNLRLLHTSSNGKNYVLGARSNVIVTREYWDNVHNKTRLKDVDLKNKQTEIRNELNRIENFILDEFKKVSDDAISKDWLKKKMIEFYDPDRGKNLSFSQNLVSYAEYYIKVKSKGWKSKTCDGHRSTVAKLKRMEKEWGLIIPIKGVNEDFKERYLEFSETYSYSPNTMEREIGRIKEYCRHAGKNGLEIYPHLNELTIKGEETNDIYLTQQELQKIRLTEFKSNRLRNARDLLLVACYTGQRVSDFMRFDTSMVRKEAGAQLLEFQQVKEPRKWMSIPITSELQTLIEERGGFPEGLSEQKFNDYVKEVCKISGLTEIIFGAKRINITPNEDLPTMRNVKGNYSKWELVSSHIGRRSFATNYFGRIPTVYLMQVTGHSRESTFLKYIKKSSTDLSLEAYRLIEALNH